MGYFNLIYQNGENNFLKSCKSSGVDGLIIVDLPYPENKNFANGTIKIGNFLEKSEISTIIGGGDTGSDCIGTSNRLGAKSVTNFEIMPKPSISRTDENPWPYWPFKLKTTSSHDEGIQREWNILTKEFVGDENGNVTGLKTVEVKWIYKKGERPQLNELKGSEKLWPCDLDLFALSRLLFQQDNDNYHKISNKKE